MKKTISKKLLALLLVCLISLTMFVFAGCDLLNNLLGMTGEAGSSYSGIGTESYSTEPLNQSPTNTMNVHYVDVGQGDCIIIQLPDGKTMIIDGGPRSAEKTILGYLQKLRITTIDYLVLTHGDEDHVGSLDNVIINTKVRNIIMPYLMPEQLETGVYSAFYSAVQDEKAQDEANVYYTHEVKSIVAEDNTYRFDFYALAKKDFEAIKKSSSAEKKNGISPLIFLEFAGKKLLFTGDANKESENHFIETFAQTPSAKQKFDVDVLKVGHHGSESSSTQDFLNIVKAENYVIQVGETENVEMDKLNKHGHPRKAVLDRITTINAQHSKNIYRTDVHGNIKLTVATDGKFEYEKATIEKFLPYWYIAIETPWLQTA